MSLNDRLITHEGVENIQQSPVTSGSCFLKCSVSSNLRCNAVGLWNWALGEHQAGSENGARVFVLLVSSLLGFTFLVVLLELLDGDRLLSHHVDEVWHSEVVQAMAP